MKSHELAKLLLSKPDTLIFHHYYNHDNFDDYGIDYIGNVSLQEDKGNLFLCVKDGRCESLLIEHFEMKELLEWSK